MPSNSWSPERAEKVCARLRMLRAEIKLSQKDVADYLGISQSAYSDYESGSTIIPVDVLYQICNYYMISMDYLLGKTEKKD